jgi:hypothetical protein
MNLLLFFVLISVSFANSNFCRDYGAIVSDYEKDFSKAKIRDCASVKTADLMKNLSGLEGTEAWLDERKCLPLSTIESELEKLKGQLSVAHGIEKLKETVKSSQRQAAQGSRVAGMTFVSSLNTAQSLEVLLQTDTFDNIPFLQKIKEVPETNRKTQLDLSNILKDLCKDKATNEENACNPKLFKPSSETSEEILKLVESAEVNPRQVEKWKGMIAIVKDSSEQTKWSFTKMQKELEGAFAAIDNNQVMSREHLNAIKKLSNFKHAPGFSFVEDIGALKDQKKVKIMSDTLLVLIGDAKLRAQYETQSKLSVLWETHKKSFSDLRPEQVESCKKAKLVYREAKLCHSHLTEASRNSDNADQKNLLLSIGGNINHADKMETSEKNCLDQIRTGALSEACYGELGKDPAVIQQQIRQLNILKERIGSENQEKMKWRNFALMKWAEKCSPLLSPMDQCDITSDVGISKNALLAVKDYMDVAVVFTPTPEAEKEAQALCEADNVKKRKNYEEKLCLLFNKTSNEIDLTKKEQRVPSTEVDNKVDHEEAALRDQYIGAVSHLLRDVARTYGQMQNRPMMNNFNPYPYNWAPFNGGTPPMGIADSILFNARYHGAYGYYMPTPGYQPGTAFGLNSPLTAYRPLPPTSGRYFGR